MHHWRVSTRREFFTQAGSGLASIALASLLDEDLRAAAKVDPLDPKPPHVPPRAKSIIWCFMEGGPSHVDLFDPKQALEKYIGQQVPPSFHPETLGVTGFGTNKNGLMPSKRVFTRHGQSGLWISDWLPYMAEHADDLAVIRSVQCDAVNHVGGVCQMNTGTILAGRPSMGAWVTYGLGSAKRNLPTFIVMQDDKEILGGVQNYSAGFLPATYQGTLFRQGDTPILNLKPPAGTTDAQERSKLDFLKDIPNLELDYGRVVVDRETMRTKNPRYFAGGDCVNGGGEVVDAVAHGKRAAAGIHQMLEARKGRRGHA